MGRVTRLGRTTVSNASSSIARIRRTLTTVMSIFILIAEWSLEPGGTGVHQKSELSGALQLTAIPACESRTCFISALKELQQCIVAGLRIADFIVGQEEFRHFGAVERSTRPNRRAFQICRSRRGIRVEHRRIDCSAPGPEAVTDYLVRIRLAGDRIGAGALGSATAGEASDCEIEASPEKMDRAAFADEAGPELLEDAVNLNEYAPEAIRVFGVVRAVLFVLGEGNRLDNFIRLRVNVHHDLEGLQRVHHIRVKVRDRARLKCERLRRAVIRVNEQSMFDEVKIHLKRSIAVRHRRSREPSRCNIEGGIPPVIYQRSLHQSNLAYDLSPHMQCAVGILPVLHRQTRPYLTI